MNRTRTTDGRQGSQQIAESIERDILEGALAEGARLPAIRDLASRLDVSPTTVAAAYRVLRSRGLVVASRRGTTVAPAPAMSPRADPGVPTSVRDLASGNPDPALLPRLGALELDHDPLLYGESQDLEELRDVASAIFSADEIPAEQIAVVGGSHDGIERALAAHLRPGDRVLVEDPGYAGTHDLARAMGLELIPVEIDDDGPLPLSVEAALRSGAAAIVYAVRAQNPTGAALSEDRARSLSAVLDQHQDVLVLEDDHAGPVSGVHARSTIGEGRRRWAAVRSVGKFLAPDLRVAVMTGDVLTIRRVQERQLVGTGWVSQILQRIVAHSWLSPETAAALDRASDAYRERRAGLLQALESRGIPARGVSGWNVWVPATPESVVVQGMRDRGWAIAPGERHRLVSPPGVRITAATLGPEEAESVASDLASVLADRPLRRSV